MEENHLNLWPAGSHSSSRIKLLSIYDLQGQTRVMKALLQVMNDPHTVSLYCLKYLHEPKPEDEWHVSHESALARGRVTPTGGAQCVGEYLKSETGRRGWRYWGHSCCNMTAHRTATGGCIKPCKHEEAVCDNRLDSVGLQEKHSLIPKHNRRPGTQTPIMCS